MPSGLKRGSSLRGKGKATPTQTKAQARKAIQKKEGSVKNGARYYHRGRGNWTKYSEARDAKVNHPTRKGMRGKKGHMGDTHRRRRGKGKV